MSQKAKEIELCSLVAVLDQMAKNGIWIKAWPNAENTDEFSRSTLNDKGGLTIYGKTARDSLVFYVAIDTYPHKSKLWLVTRFDIVVGPTWLTPKFLTPTKFYEHININQASQMDLDNGDLSYFWTISSARDLLRFFEEYNKAARFFQCPELFIL
jgi:hypothetical protein